MSPKEKAEELIDKYSSLGIGHPTSLFLPKQCALITVNEILNYISRINRTNKDVELELSPRDWIKVKEEIEKP